MNDECGDGEMFAAAVAAAVAAVPHGHVVTYGDIAAEVGRPQAARAVGRVLAGADGLPWWRVVTASGRLVPGKEDEHARRLRAEGVILAAGRVAVRRG